MNQSKKKDSRFWHKWKNSGAVGNITIFSYMSLWQLGNYVMAVNIFVSNGQKTGILINMMDMEPSEYRVKVLVDGDFQYWTEKETRFIKTKPRKWKTLQS